MIHTGLKIELIAKQVMSIRRWSTYYSKYQSVLCPQTATSDHGYNHGKAANGYQQSHAGCKQGIVQDDSYVSALNNHPYSWYREDTADNLLQVGCLKLDTELQNLLLKNYSYCYWFSKKQTTKPYLQIIWQVR